MLSLQYTSILSLTSINNLKEKIMRLLACNEELINRAIRNNQNKPTFYVDIAQEVNGWLHFEYKIHDKVFAKQDVHLEKKITNHWLDLD